MDSMRGRSSHINKANIFLTRLKFCYLTFNKTQTTALHITSQTENIKAERYEQNFKQILYCRSNVPLKFLNNTENRYCTNCVRPGCGRETLGRAENAGLKNDFED